MKAFLIKLISDPDGNISSARFLNVLVGICGCLISWKLVITSGYNENYFALLLAYGSGTFAAGKFFERKEQGNTSKQQPIADVDTNVKDNDVSLKPPKP